VRRITRRLTSRTHVLVLLFTCATGVFLAHPIVHSDKGEHYLCPLCVSHHAGIPLPDSGPSVELILLIPLQLICLWKLSIPREELFIPSRVPRSPPFSSV